MVVVSLAVGKSLVFEEGTSEGAFAELAVEVLRMPLCAESVDAIAKNRLVARSAARREDLMEAAIAVGAPVALEEISSEG